MPQPWGRVQWEHLAVRPHLPPGGDCGGEGDDVGELQAWWVPKLSWMRPRAACPPFGAGPPLSKGLDGSTGCLHVLAVSPWHCPPLDPAQPWWHSQSCCLAAVAEHLLWGALCFRSSRGNRCQSWHCLPAG